jgi:NAD(P)-dependent dehydrogenase (short-subunit alcohol dehydrogenase family)|tara:strand:- start:10301 stop:11005 length:705 start_codon:yes stop_codon:yes gene_type:complete
LKGIAEMKTVLITGSNRGLGLEFVKHYSENNYNVIACCRNTDDANDLYSLSKKNDSIQIYALNVGNTDQINVLSKSLQNQPIDILINNAGIYRSSTLGNINKDDWVDSFLINTIAPFEIIQNFLPHLLNGESKKVISITSKMGSIDDNTSGGSYIYRTSKTALNSMMRSLSHDLLGQGISTLTLHPGWVRTDMGGAGAWIDVNESVKGMINQIEKLSTNNSGRYIDYAGKPINW